MLVGVPKEIKNHEYRVGLTPESVSELVAQGHSVIVETSAGVGMGADDGQYRSAGAEITPTADEVFHRADMIVKVKEPQAAERKMLREGQILYTYLHLAPDPAQTKDLVDSGAICIAYETVTDATGGLPLLKPMSQVAGRMSVQAGASALENARGGRGVLLGGVPGVAPAKVVIVGGGVVGFNAAQMAVGMHADVTILDRNPTVLERLENHFESYLFHQSRSGATHLGSGFGDWGRVDPGRSGSQSHNSANVASHAARRGDRGRSDRSRRVLRNLESNHAR